MRNSRAMAIKKKICDITQLEYGKIGTGSKFTPVFVCLFALFTV